MQKEGGNFIINEKTYDKSKAGKFELCFSDPEAVYDDYRLANFKYLIIEQFQDFIGKSVVLLQDFRLNKGGTFWDGSYLTTKYIIEYCLKESDKKPLNFLEIGSGTSLPSIVLGLKGHKIVTTDLEYLLPFVNSNIDENLKGSDKESNVIVKKLEWGNEEDMEKIASVESNFDIIIASEVIYIETVFDELISTFKYFCKKNTVIVLTYRFRMKEKLELFFSKFDLFFDYSYVDRSVLDRIHPNKDLHVLIASLKKEFL